MSVIKVQIGVLRCFSDFILIKKKHLMDNLATIIPRSGVSALLIVTFSAESNTHTCSRVVPPAFFVNASARRQTELKHKLDFPQIYSPPC